MKYKNEYMMNRQYILWGEKRHIYEFSYMFDFLDFYGYVAMDEDKRYESVLRQLDLETLTDSCNRQCIVIICSLKKEKYISMLEEIGLLDKITYEYFEEFFYLLDPFRKDILDGRKIAVWGTGETEKNFQRDCVKNEYEVNVDAYIDSDLSKKGSLYCDIPIKTISEIDDISRYFIIVASIYYFDIKKELTKYGLIEGKDYLPFSCFASKPSAMMGKLIRTEEMSDFICDRPYTWFYYAWFGAYSCCSTWVKYPIGNPAADTPEECWNSIVAKLYRLSADTRTYCFCKKEACGLIGNRNNKKFEKRNYSIPDKITLGLDYTCNLHCASCRTHLMVASGNQFRIREKFAEDIIHTGWLEKTKELELSGAGEALFSKIDRKLLFSGNEVQRESISLMTNGILLNDSNLRMLKQHFKKLRLNISIDAATEKTYIKLRRGGNWNILLGNLEKVSRMRQHGEIEYVEIRMVVQKSNYKEMIDFIQMGKDYCVDRVVFTKLLNWDMFESEEYLEEAMLNRDGSLRTELEQILRQDVFQERMVQISEFRRYFK